MVDVQVGRSYWTIIPIFVCVFVSVCLSVSVSVWVFFNAFERINKQKELIALDQLTSYVQAHNNRDPNHLHLVCD